MARNTGGGRVGQVKNRSQFFSAEHNRWVKRDTRTGRIVAVKADEKPYKGVRKERGGRHAD